MKNSVVYPQKFKRTAFGVFVCLTAIFMIASICIVSGTTAPPPKRQDIIDAYLSYLSEAGTSTARNANLILPELPGMGTEDSALPDMTLEEAENAGVYGLNRPQTFYSEAKVNQYSAIAVQQHDLVVEQFGADAWDNVSYELEEIEPLNGTVGYKVIATGELISQEEYEQLIRTYWDGVAEQAGVTYYDMFLEDDEPVENMENKRVDLIAEYIDGLPAELTMVSDSQTYNVNLTFNGAACSDQEYENFKFVIDNSDGEWTVFQGLTWLVPYPDFPESD